MQTPKAGPGATVILHTPRNKKTEKWQVRVEFKGTSTASICLQGDKEDAPKVKAVSSSYSYTCSTASSSRKHKVKAEEEEVEANQICVHGALRCGSSKESVVMEASSREVVVESSHNYEDSIHYSGCVRIEGCDALQVRFDRRCSTESTHDPLRFYDDESRRNGIARQYCGDRDSSSREGALEGQVKNWSDFSVMGDTLYFSFESDSSQNGWGWRFTVSEKSAPAVAPRHTTGMLCPLRIS